MQSSVGVACRALIMLAFLVGIPWVAVSGASWPEVGRRLQAKWQELGVCELWAFISPSPSQTLTEAPQFEPTQDNANPAANACDLGVAAPLALNLPSQPISSESAASSIAAGPTNGVVAAGHQTRSDAAFARQTVATTDQNTVVAASGDAQPLASGEQSTAIQNRLRQLGATYYVLESWGADRPLYRFSCKMAIGGSGDYTRYFEATEANPLQTMSDVLRQVENWRKGDRMRMETSASDVDQ